MPQCEQKVGCHFCVNFLSTLEVKMDRILEAIEKASTPEMVFAIKDSLEFIRAFKKGG